MSPGRLPLGEGESAWERLADALELGTDFTLHAVEIPASLIADELARRIEALGFRVALRRLTGWQAAAATLEPPLTERPAAFLIVAEEREDGPGSAQWRVALRRLNQTRNGLMRRFPGDLLICGPRWFHALAWEEAPDLWSGRNGPFRFPMPPGLEELIAHVGVWDGFDGTPPELRRRPGVPPEAPDFPALRRLLERRATALEGMGATREALTLRIRAAVALFADHPVADVLTALDRLRPTADPRLRLRVAVERARATIEGRGRGAAAALAEGALTLARDLPDPIDRVHALRTAANLRTNEFALLDEAIRVAREADEREAEVRALCERAEAQVRRGDLEGATRSIEFAAERAAATGQAQLTATVTEVQADLAERRGALDTAARDYLRASEALRAAGHLLDSIAPLVNAVGILERLGRLDEAEKLLDRALIDSRRLAIPRLESEALVKLASLYQDRGALKEAEGVLRRARHLARSLQWPMGELKAMLETARLERARGNNQRAVQVLRDVMAKAERCGLPDLVDSYLIQLSESLISLGRPHEALEAAESVRTSLRRVGEPYLARVRLVLARIYTHLGDADQAREELFEAMRAFEAMGDRRHLAVAFDRLAQVNAAQGDLQTAADFAARSVRIAESMGDLRSLGLGLYSLARIERTRGRPEEALHLLERSTALLEGVGDLRKQAMTLHLSAVIHRDAGDIATALERARRAWRLVADLHDPDGISAVGATLGELLAAEGDVKGARKVLASAVKAFEHMGRKEQARTLKKRLRALRNARR